MKKEDIEKSTSSSKLKFGGITNTNNSVNISIDTNKPVQQDVAAYCLAIVERFLNENTDCLLTSVVNAELQDDYVFKRKTSFAFIKEQKE